MTGTISAFEYPIRKLRRESQWLAAEFIKAAKAGRNKQTQLACEMAVIRLHDAWARFCRELVILSAVGNIHTLGGTPLMRANNSFTEYKPVILAALTINKGRSVKWADATNCIKTAKALAIKNISIVSPALSAANSPAEEMRRVRNFYAHRRHFTAMEVAATSIFSKPTQPIIFELANYTAGNVRIIESWVQRLMLVAVAAAQ